MTSFISFCSTRTSFFILFNVLYGTLFSGHFVQFFHFSLEQEYTPHFSLILLISLYLLLLRRQQLSGVVAYWPRGGVPLALVGLGGVVAGLSLQQRLSPQDFLAVTTAGVLTIWIGGFVTFFGRQATKIALFPLAFLGFLVPLPEGVLSGIITALQYASADLVHVLFQLTPLPVLRDGVFFMLPGLHIEVARECSSIRSSMALLITCVLVSHLFLRRWWTTAMVLLAVFPLAVLKNGVRIVALCLLSIYVDDDFMTGGLHTRGGAVFFGVSLLLFLGMLAALRKLETWKHP